MVCVRDATVPRATVLSEEGHQGGKEGAWLDCRTKCPCRFQMICITCPTRDVDMSAWCGLFHYVLQPIRLQETPRCKGTSSKGTVDQGALVASKGPRARQNEGRDSLGQTSAKNEGRGGGARKSRIDGFVGVLIARFSSSRCGYCRLNFM